MSYKEDVEIIKLEEEVVEEKFSEVKYVLRRQSRSQILRVQELNKKIYKLRRRNMRFITKVIK